MLIRRRLDMLTELVIQERLEVVVEQVESARNKADKLTRVPKKWLSSPLETPVMDEQCDATGLAAPAGRIADGNEMRLEVKRIHEQHHFGVDRTFELARQCLGHDLSRQMVKDVVTDCVQCARIDPAVNFRWQKGSIATSEVWQRLALDITHVNGRPYMSCSDCCSRYTIWRALKNETEQEVNEQLAMIFAEMGPPEEILTDNGTVFRGAKQRRLLDVWMVKADFSCAYRPQGNGLVERVHRTIKRMVARSGRSVGEMTFWYNATRGERLTSPYEMVFGAKPRMPSVLDRRQGSHGCGRRRHALLVIHAPTPRTTRSWWATRFF